MAQFTKKRNFGPRIYLTERQEEKLIAKCNAAGLTCFVENCDTGSVYVAIGRPEWSKNIRGEWFHDLDCGCSDGIAKIRLSGHDEGIRQDSTHNCVHTKTECMKALNRWVDELIEKHSEECLAIIANGPKE